MPLFVRQGTPHGRPGGAPGGAPVPLPLPYRAIPMPSHQLVCWTTACWGGAMFKVPMSMPPTARIRYEASSSLV